MAAKAELTREGRIKREIARLAKLFKDLPKERQDASRSLIANAAFMTITLEDLQEAINQKGVISEYQNGDNQWGTKKSPEVEVYNTMQKNHLATIKQLCDLLPDGGPEKPGEDELMAFVRKARR